MTKPIPTSVHGFDLHLVVNPAQHDQRPVFKFKRRQCLELLDRQWQIADEESIRAVRHPWRLASRMAHP